jgi:hypothetical protein
LPVTDAYFPLLHEVQTVDIVPEENLPTAHAVHTVKVVAPTAVDIKPAPQAIQTDNPVLLA